MDGLKDKYDTSKERISELKDGTKEITLECKTKIQKDGKYDKYVKDMEEKARKLHQHLSNTHNDKRQKIKVEETIIEEMISEKF